MKKLMFVAALAATAALWADGLESANTVGYQTTTVKANDMTMIGIQFTDTGSTDGISINSIKGNFTAGLTSGEADNLYVWDAVNGYTVYFYYVVGHAKPCGYTIMACYLRQIKLFFN